MQDNVISNTAKYSMDALEEVDDCGLRVHRIQIFVTFICVAP
jgi:hypothetical protein